MGRRGRPVDDPTDQTRTLVRRLSGMAVTQDDIAQFVAISDVCLRKYYSADLARGRAEANLKVTQALFKNATRENNPNVVAQMFWLKNQAGWKDMAVVAATDSVNTLQIEFVGPRAIVEAVRATQGPVINGEAHEARTVHDVEPEASEGGADADADADVDGELGDMTQDDAAMELFEAPLPEPDPDL